MDDLGRQLASHIPRFRRGYPVIAVLGPRQSGKSTLVQAAARDLPFVNFEDIVERVRFANDPHGFFARFPDGAIIDEAQHVPEIFSALQVRVDADRRMGRWILTGSQQLEMTKGIGQSMTGRVAMLELLPFSLAELAGSPRRPRTLVEAVLRGGYAPLYDGRRDLDPIVWLDQHLQTILSRDLADLLSVRNRLAFANFVALCAAHTGQQANLAEIAGAVGITHATASAWLSVLEAVFLVRVMRPYDRNFGKRVVKRPKLYFLDSGLACRLLHIGDVNQLRDHPRWGALVETWCVSEVVKSFTHRGVRPSLWFWRSSDGHEVDLIIDRGDRLLPIEIKATRTPDPDLTRPLRHLRTLAKGDDLVRIERGWGIYGGEDAIPSGEDRLVPWHAIDGIGQGLVPAAEPSP